MLKRVSDFYTKSLHTKGPSPEGVGWRDQESQELRFAKLCEVVTPQDRASGVVVSDLGCGYGALFNFLRPRMDVRHYYGYDISPEMVRAAQQHHPHKEATFIESSRLLHETDYTFLSGIFTVKLDVPEDEWLEHIKATLTDVARMSRKGFAFNALSTYVDWRQPLNTFYGDPGYFFSFCKEHLSKYVSLLHDYPLFEWTILVRKEIL